MFSEAQASVSSSSAGPVVAWQALRGVSLLQSLSDEKLSQVAQQCLWHRLDAGQVLHGPYTNQRLYMLISGSLSVASHGANGRSLILGHILPGRFFGPMVDSTIAGQVAITVQATQDSLVASLSNEELEELIASDVQVIRAVVQQLVELSSLLARRVVNLGTLSVRGRLHAELLEQAQLAGIEDDEALLSPAPRQQDLALLLGTSREEVAREMSRLTRLGLLQREGRNLHICRVDGLRMLLEES